MVAGRNFEAGELGPGTIVGSAAFNLFVIISLCVYVIPNDEVRRIKHLRVFFVTATWSLVAYVWLYLIIAYITPGVINVSQSPGHLFDHCLPTHNWQTEKYPGITILAANFLTNLAMLQN